jgi:RNA polymerase sigma factor (sigma-70 family)
VAPTSPAVDRRPQRGDETELFLAHHRDLLRLVARDVTARPQVIEDACAFAWAELVVRQPERINIVGWLRVVARREAIRLVAHDRRMATLAPGADVRSAAGGELLRLDARDALELLAALPARKRTVLALQVSGCSYAEIGRELQMTSRTVERQVLRARAAVRCHRQRQLASRAARA